MYVCFKFTLLIPREIAALEDNLNLQCWCSALRIGSYNYCMFVCTYEIWFVVTVTEHSVIVIKAWHTTWYKYIACPLALKALLKL